MPGTEFWGEGMELFREFFGCCPDALEEIKSLPLRWDEERFSFWLKQDFPFVEALYRFQVGLLREAPHPHRVPLVQALMATVEELDWLLSQGADPREPVHPVRQEYIALLQEMEGFPYPYRLVFFYFLNRLFLEAWNAHVEGNGPWQELAEHWSAPEFQAVLFDLEVMAQGQVEGLDPGVLEHYLARILEMEKKTWSLLL
ncbi:hypothetical protein CSW25_12765 [Thermus scotoductus]|uniref:Uncharacterized protein n=2 Tax=Thermus scotoductus TaxID=37636 RepID=A0A430S4X0_THESC|nr:hypothetical protein CSW48_12505 [Thermus scotoductus]RTH07968.1 hypothetical protein CSW44_13200 [Thermus scotoductus]RTH09182.1 hypothetical protein CSW43_11765 [Thermus scotoductus]RTH11398.1 hypothetical protein CSW46_04700 [Thermus scotoductus]RTH15283.1 hypothetical protein CSW39_12230 [Thermus scotoductus]